MARPVKQGLEYFPLDVHLDDKIRFIEVKYKLEGFALIIKLLQKIYSYGYWYQWGEDQALLFADENRTTLDLVNGVIEEALDRGIFNGHLYEKYQILTSRGIQKRYKEGCRRRKEIEIINEYLLIDSIISVNDVNNSVNDVEVTALSIHDDGKSTQSKVKDSKKKSNNKKKVYMDNVLLSDEQYNSIADKYGEKGRAKIIDLLSAYKLSSGREYKDDYAAMRNWVFSRYEKDFGWVQTNKPEITQAEVVYE